MDQDDHHPDYDKSHGWSDKHSSPAPAPEIDPASLVAALTLLGSGLAVQKIRADLSVLDTFRAF